MTYEEAVERADEKLAEWIKTQSSYSTYYQNSETSATFFIHDRSHLTEAHYSEPKLTFYYTKLRYVRELTDIFKDPLEVSKEEAEMFKLEYGFDYPKELISDLRRDYKES